MFALWCQHMTPEAALWLQHGQHTHSFTALWPLPLQLCRDALSSAYTSPVVLKLPACVGGVCVRECVSLDSTLLSCTSVAATAAAGCSPCHHCCFYEQFTLPLMLTCLIAITRICMLVPSIQVISILQCQHLFVNVYFAIP